MTAKAVEDCYFYRDARLVSLNEVGGDPHRFGVSAAEFHRSAAVRAQLWPHTMTTLSTHDTKRGEDVRARIGVLSQVPALWAELVTRWEKRRALPRSADRTVPVAEHLRGVARRRRGDRRAARPAARLRREGDPGGRPAHLVDRSGRRRSKRACTAGWTPCFDGPVAGELTELVGAAAAARAQRRPGPEAAGAHRARRPRRLPGHRTVGGQPGRPGQPPAGRLRRAPRRAAPAGAPQDAGGRARRCTPAATGPRPSCTAATGRCWPPGRPPSTCSPSCAATTSWSRSAGGRCGSPKPAGATPSLALPEGPGPTGSPGRATAGTVPAAELFAELPVALLERADG